MTEKLVQQIKLNQRKEDCPFEEIVDYMEENLTVGEIYAVYFENPKVMDDCVNIYIQEIVEIEDDYLIRGGDAKENLIEIKFSKTKFWIS